MRLNGTEISTNELSKDLVQVDLAVAFQDAVRHSAKPVAQAVTPSASRRSGCQCLCWVAYRIRLNAKQDCLFMPN